MIATNEIRFSQAQLDFLEFVRVVFQGRMIEHWANERFYFALSYMEGSIPAGGKEVCATFFTTRSVRLKKGMLTEIDFKWSGESCDVSEFIGLHKPYFDEDAWVGEDSDCNTRYGEMVSNDVIYLTASWTKAAWMLYHMVGIQKKSDRRKFVELVKAL